MKKLLFLMLCIFPALFSSEAESLTSRLPNIESFLALNRYQKQFDNQQGNLSLQQADKKPSRPLLTAGDIFSSLALATGVVALKSCYSLARHGEPLSKNQFVGAVFQEFLIKISYDICYNAARIIEPKIPEKITKKIDSLSPILNQKDILTMAEIGAHSIIKQIVEDKQIYPSRVNRAFISAIGSRYARNKAEMAAMKINEQFDLLDPNKMPYKTTAFLGGMAVQMGAYILIGKWVDYYSQTIFNRRMELIRDRAISQLLSEIDRETPVGHCA